MHRTWKRYQAQPLETDSTLVIQMETIGPLHFVVFISTCNAWREGGIEPHLSAISFLSIGFDSYNRVLVNKNAFMTNPLVGPNGGRHHGALLFGKTTNKRGVGARERISSRFRQIIIWKTSWKYCIVATKRSLLVVLPSSGGVEPLFATGYHPVTLVEYLC